MQKSSFCISTGKCVANAYRKVAEGTAQFRTFFSKVIRAATEQFRSSCRLELDHPQQDEKITSTHYTFRIGTYGDTERVEISINQGHWQPCRHSVGYWWHDWSGYTKGRHQAVAKARTKDGQVFTSETRKFQVV